MSTAFYTETVRARRCLLFVDWSIRRCLPAWLRAAGLGDLATSLALRPPIEDATGVVDALPAVLRATWETRLRGRVGASPAPDDYVSTWFTAWRAALADLGLASEGSGGVDVGVAQDAWAALEQAAQVVALLPPSFARAADDMGVSVQALVVRMCAVHAPRVRPGAAR